MKPPNVEELEKLASVVEGYVTRGKLPSAQFAIAQDGEIIAERAFGKIRNVVHADRGNDGNDGEPRKTHALRPATTDTVYLGFSTTKPIVSSALWLLLEQNKVGLQEPVVDIIPEFDTNGKSAVLVEQLLTHTCGFPGAPFGVDDWDDKTRRYKRFAQWRLDWQPGSRFTYHPVASMWVVAEIIERRGGKDFRGFVSERILQPLGLNDFHLGLPSNQSERLAKLEMVGQAPTPEQMAKLGMKELPDIGVTEESLKLYNSRPFLTVGFPGGGGVTTAASLALFYQALLAGGVARDGTRIWKEETVMDARRCRTGDFRDPNTGKIAMRGLGLVLAGDESRVFRSFGEKNSPASFGHAGIGGQLSWADPESGLSFAFVTNGLEQNFLEMGGRTVTLSSQAARIGV